MVRVFQMLVMAAFAFVLGPVLLRAQTPSPVPSGGGSSVSSENDWAFYKKYGKGSKSWNPYVQKGFEAYDRQDCEQAIANFKEAIKEGCNDPIMLFKLAACSELTGSYVSASQYYKESESGLKLLKVPHRYQKDFYEAYGRVLFLSQKPDEALPYFLKAAEMGTPSFTLFYLIAEIHLSKNQLEQGLQFFNQALTQPLDKVPPQQLGRVFTILGRSFFDKKDWSRALEFFDKALQASPDNPEVQKLKYKAQEMKRQDEIFKRMERINLPR